MDGWDFRGKLATSLPLLGQLVLLEMQGKAHGDFRGNGWIGN